MRMAVLTGSLLLLGVAVIGCGDGGPQGTIDSSLPVVSVKVEGMH